MGTFPDVPARPSSTFALLQALSSVDSVMMMYPFFYRPQDLRLEEGWHLFPLEQYFQKIAAQVSLGRGEPQLAGEGEKRLPRPTPCCSHPASHPDKPVAAERPEQGFHHLPHVPCGRHRAGGRER